MTTKEAAVDPQAELIELRKQVADLERSKQEQDNTIATLNGIVGEYQQLHADAVMQATTFKTQLRVMSAQGAAPGQA